MPTAAGFLDFIRTQMGIVSANLPDNSPSIQLSYDIAIEIVNLAINEVSPLIYAQAVYNLAGDNLINFAPDATGKTFFADLRKRWNILGFVGGVVSSTADETTSEAMVTPDFIKGLMLADLQYLKTPYGRQYLAYAQRYGSLWGLS